MPRGMPARASADTPADCILRRMRGLLVVGAVHGADEAAVGVAAAGALDPAGGHAAEGAAVAGGAGAAVAACG